MTFKELQESWNHCGKRDPLWSILTHPDKKDNKWDLHEFFATGEREIQELIEYITALGVHLPHNLALDFGCGVGRLTQALAKRFAQVYGLDISSAMIRLANKYNTDTEKCVYRTNIEPDLKSFKDNSFDLIYSSLVLQHMEPVYSKLYINEFIRVIAPHGIIIFQLPGMQLEVPQLEKPNTCPKVEASSLPTLSRALKNIIKSMAPPKVLAWYVRTRWPDPPANERLYGMPREEVRRLVEESGGRIVDIVSNQDAGPNWESYRYTVSKGVRSSKGPDDSRMRPS